MFNLRSYIILLSAVFLIIGGCGKNTQQNASNNNDTTNVQANNPGNAPNANAPASQAPRPQTRREKEITVPMSTQLLVTLTDSVQTNKNQSGDRFSGVVASPVVVDGKTVIPEGSHVELAITNLVKGGTLKTVPEISITVREISLSGGQNYSVSTDQISERGRSHTKREVGMIGGGAAAGGIIGGILGKGKGAAIGAATGAAAGTGVAAATGRQNLVYPSGQTLTFTLKQPVVINATQ